MAEESFWVASDVLLHFVDVALNGEQVGLDAVALTPELLPQFYRSQAKDDGSRTARRNEI